MQATETLKQSSLFDWRDPPTSLTTFLTGVDESEAYEVDYTEIWTTNDGYALVTASGCSCWDGDYNMTTYSTLDALEADLKNTERDYGNPSIETCDLLMKEARLAAQP